MVIMQWDYDLTFVYTAATGLQSTGEGCTCNNFLASVGWVCNTKASQFVPSIKFKIGRFFETHCCDDLQPILQDTPEHLNLLTFLLRTLKAERCDFPGENCSGAGALSKHGFCPCPSIIRNSKRRTQNPSKSLKKLLLSQKDNNIPPMR